MMPKVTILLVAVAMVSSLVSAQGSDSQYPGGKSPGAIASVFAPGLVSGPAQEYGLSVTAGWSEIYFTRLEGDQAVIMVTTRRGESWSDPVPTSFSGQHIDGHPCLLADGQQLYFISRRPCPGAKQALNVWKVDRTGEGWSDPRSLGPPVTNQTVHAPSVSSSGNIYATGLVRLRYSENRYQPPERLSPDIKGSHPAVAPDDSFIVFGARREGGFGSKDLYVTFKQENGTWGPPKNLGEGVNTGSVESSPSLSLDGKFLFFSRQEDIWWVDARIIQSVR
jgi:hypothetical protein